VAQNTALTPWASRSLIGDRFVLRPSTTTPAHKRESIGVWPDIDQVRSRALFKWYVNASLPGLKNEILTEQEKCNCSAGCSETTRRRCGKTAKVQAGYLQHHSHHITYDDRGALFTCETYETGRCHLTNDNLDLTEPVVPEEVRVHQMTKPVPAVCAWRRLQSNVSCTQFRHHLHIAFAVLNTL